jgi:hypothetical protein
MTEQEFQIFEAQILALMYSNRYKKADDFLKDIDFSLIRGVLYSYSENERIKALSNKHIAILFHHFYI